MVVMSTSSHSGHHVCFNYVSLLAAGTDNDISEEFAVMTPSNCC